MEPILQAVQRAKSVIRPASAPTAADASAPALLNRDSERARQDLSIQHGPSKTDASVPLSHIELQWDQLERQRIVSHNVADPRSKAYDILRTQLLQSMDRKNWHLLAVTSPTESCGKTVTSINLAFSIARQQERSVVLIDLDLQRPRVASCLGIKRDVGVVSVLSGRSKLADSMVRAEIGGYTCNVLPAETRSLHSSELIASRAMRSMLQETRTLFPEAAIILDLPPVMSGDDVLSIVPSIDCAILVASVGRSTVSDVRECSKYLQGTELLRIVLNKSSDPQTYYGQRAPVM